MNQTIAVNNKTELEELIKK